MDWQIQPSEFKWSHRQCCLCEKAAKVTFPFISIHNLNLNSVEKKIILSCSWLKKWKQKAVCDETRAPGEKEREDSSAVAFFSGFKLAIIDWSKKINKKIPEYNFFGYNCHKMCGTVEIFGARLRLRAMEAGHCATPFSSLGLLEWARRPRCTPALRSSASRLGTPVLILSNSLCYSMKISMHLILKISDLF